jgi:hypothetical protein
MALTCSVVRGVGPEASEEAGGASSYAGAYAGVVG